jgi:hypothetical protein
VARDDVKVMTYSADQVAEVGESDAMIIAANLTE